MDEIINEYIRGTGQQFEEIKKAKKARLRLFWTREEETVETELPGKRKRGRPQRQGEVEVDGLLL